MRRAAALVFVFLIIICMPLPARADSAAASYDFRAVVDSSGSCQITVLLNLHLESPEEDLVFPVPASAYDILVNGTKPDTSRKSSVLLLDLGRILGAVTGDFSLSITYSLPDVIDDADSEAPLALNLPILCGFSLPIDSTAFTVVLPGPVEVKPSLTSTYYQTRIEEHLTLTNQDSQIHGALNTRILGSDWLTMTMQVDDGMFPQKRRPVWNLDLPDLAMIGFALLSLVYWLVFLRCLPPRAIRRTTGPDGITAGDIGPALTQTRPDLTMLVLQWAQMGYILIQLDNNGRVLLHKRMNMGNERSLYETRIFRSLFGSRNLIDGTGSRYALLCRKVAAGKPGVHGLFQRGSGNPMVFRFLAALIGLFGGISIGSALGDGTALRDLLAVLLGMFGLISAWFIQEGCKYLHLRKKTLLWVSLGLWCVWIILGHMALEPIVATCASTAQLLAGLAAAYGGRRTELGKQTSAQILGLRRFMKTASKEDLQRILNVNPEYFYTLAPYALAMGVDQKFAKQFGGMRMPACPYLTAGLDGHKTALEWSRTLRTAVNILEEGQTRLVLEQLLGR